jgi:outer membrane protein TolC
MTVVDSTRRCPCASRSLVHRDAFRSGVALVASAGLIWQATSAAAAEDPMRMTLDAVLDRVVATDQTIGIADYEVRKAAVEQMRAFTRILPSLSVGADADWRGSRTKEEVEIEVPVTQAPAPQTPEATVPGATGAPAAPAPVQLTRVVRESRWTRTHSHQRSIGLNFNQPILDFTLGPARRQTAVGRQITVWQLRQQLREVLFGVTSQFFEVLKQEELVIENRKTLGLTTQQVQQAEARLEAQEVIASDVLQARVDDERARRAVMISENSRDLARARLAITLNYPTTTRFSLIEPTSGRLGADDLPDAVTLAQSNREDVHIAQLTLSRGYAERAEIMARFAPTLDFQFSQDATTSSSVDRNIGWTAGLSLNWTLIDRGQRLLDLKQNQLQINQDGLRIGDTLRIVSDDVAGAWYAIDRFKKTLTSLVVERQAAESAYTVQQEKYRAGLATSLEVQTAIRDLARVRAEAVAATYDLEIAYREFENVLALYQNPRIEETMQRLLSPVVAPTSPSQPHPRTGKS